MAKAYSGGSRSEMGIPLGMGWSYWKLCQALTGWSWFNLQIMGKNRWTMVGSSCFDNTSGCRLGSGIGWVSVKGETWARWIAMSAMSFLRVKLRASQLIQPLTPRGLSPEIQRSIHCNRTWPSCNIQWMYLLEFVIVESNHHFSPLEPSFPSISVIFWRWKTQSLLYGTRIGPPTPTRPSLNRSGDPVRPWPDPKRPAMVKWGLNPTRIGRYMWGHHKIRVYIASVFWCSKEV